MKLITYGHVAKKSWVIMKRTCNFFQNVWACPSMIDWQWSTCQRRSQRVGIIKTIYFWNLFKKKSRAQIEADRYFSTSFQRKLWTLKRILIHHLKDEMQHTAECWRGELHGRREGRQVRWAKAWFIVAASCQVQWGTWQKWCNRVFSAPAHWPSTV